MSDDIEQRLAAAAQAYREYEICGKRCADLQARKVEITAEAATTRELSADEGRRPARGHVIQPGARGTAPLPRG